MVKAMQPLPLGWARQAERGQIGRLGGMGNWDAVSMLQPINDYQRSYAQNHGNSGVGPECRLCFHMHLEEGIQEEMPTSPRSLTSTLALRHASLEIQMA